MRLEEGGQCNGVLVRVVGQHVGGADAQFLVGVFRNGGRLHVVAVGNQEGGVPDPLLGVGQCGDRRQRRDAGFLGDDAAGDIGVGVVQADQHVHLVLLNQLVGQVGRGLQVRCRVVDDVFHRMSIDAAGRVDFFHRQRKSPGSGHVVAIKPSGQGEQSADFDVLFSRQGAAGQQGKCQGADQEDADDPVFHIPFPSFRCFLCMDFVSVDFVFRR